MSRVCSWNRAPAESIVRVLIIAATTGYQTRAFGEAAERLGVELVFATDRCHQLDDPWQDEAIPVRFHQEHESTRAIVKAARDKPIDGLLVVGDRPTVIAAHAAQALGLPGHDPDAVRRAGNKLLARRAFQQADLPIPSFQHFSIDQDPELLASRIAYPCVVKPLTLSGSRGVIRADDRNAFVSAFRRVGRLLRQKTVRAMRDPGSQELLVEEFIEGREYAIEGLLDHGTPRILAIFDKPDPLDGPYFEETIYVTPSRAPRSNERDITRAVKAAVGALGLYHGPIHAECRIGPAGVFVLEVAARPIGGLCARALRFEGADGDLLSLEELLLRHAVGAPTAAYVREGAASGVMMIPIPRAGWMKRVEGVDEALAVKHVEEVRITAKTGQQLVPLPEGASYLGFIFARASKPIDVESALREAHGKLRFVIGPPLAVVGSEAGAE
ncbi:MAG: ATP-grasp domain-containing protein [Acidobacteria bacterium]|nr:ATP-grasp domain-containing protein [Acidobacteriota bacterium]